MGTENEYGGSWMNLKEIIEVGESEINEFRHRLPNGGVLLRRFLLS